MTVWTHGTDTLEVFLEYLNQIDSTGQIKFLMQVQNDYGLEFKDFKFKSESDKITVITFAKPTNSSIFL